MNVADSPVATFILAASYVAVRRLIGPPSVPYVGIGKEVAAAGLMGAVLWLLGPFVPQDHYLTILLVGLGAAVYVGVLLAISGRIRGKLMELLPRSLSA